VSRLEAEGPNVRNVARLLGENEATVRYWIKEKLAKNGFILHAAVNYDALGVQKVTFVARISEKYLPLAHRIFEEMNQFAYLTSYTGNLLDGTYWIMASVPKELLEEFRSYVAELKAEGFFTEVSEVTSFEWFRVLPMKVNSYNFDLNTWDVALAKPVAKSEVRVLPAQRTKFDATDLKIIVKLQVNAFTSVKDVAQKIGVSYKKTLRHYGHVLRRGLVPHYRMLWLRTPYIPETGKTRNITHDLMVVYFMVSDLRGKELERLMLEVHRMPFVWSEMGGRNYFCDMAFPLSLANEALTNLKRIATNYYGRTRTLVMASDDAMTYTITADLYDQKSKRWTFDPESSLARIRNLLLAVEKRQPG
jgi:DNA-binding Lrp family transcriptional regulator